jgi:hypothetical protein
MGLFSRNKEPKHYNHIVEMYFYDAFTNYYNYSIKRKQYLNLINQAKEIDKNSNTDSEFLQLEFGRLVCDWLTQNIDSKILNDFAENIPVIEDKYISAELMIAKIYLYTLKYEHILNKYQGLFPIHGDSFNDSKITNAYQKAKNSIIRNPDAVELNKKANTFNEEKNVYIENFYEIIKTIGRQYGYETSEYFKNDVINNVEKKLQEEETN